MIGRKPRNHLMNKTSQTPPIDINPMPLLLNNLGGQILGRATNTHGQIPVPLQYLTQSKIRQLQVSLPIDNDVLGLQTIVRQ
jgi:hypothetical protein